MKKVLLFFLSSFIVFAATIFYRLGGYKPVDVRYQEHPELKLLYKEHIGPYHKINDVLREVETWAVTHGLACSRTFGEYFDDPRTTEERRLRSHGGCVLDETPKDSGEFKFKIVAPNKYVIAKFEGAPSISPLKVYPKAEKFMSEHKLAQNGAVIEIYLIKSESEAVTEYLFPVSE